MTNQRLAIDVGGIFVDFVLFDEDSGEVHIEKVSSRSKLEYKFFEGIERLRRRQYCLDSFVQTFSYNHIDQRIRGDLT